MVLYKRKVVEAPQPSWIPEDDDLVWLIPITEEYFQTYDEYLDRIDFYSQRKFICELTGHSCLTFFEAFRSELNETEQVIKTFPEPLKEPILRKVQFSQISRLDGLVDDVYNTLRNEFYPGEVAIARVRDQRLKVIIREKAKFNSITLANGEVRPAYSRCRVELAATPGQELAVDESQLIRDRKKFTKVILRTFIKYAVSRESWAGAPWLVKDDYAKMYRIDQQIPLHLQKLALEHKKTTEPKGRRNREEELLRRAQEKAEKKVQAAAEKRQAQAAAAEAAAAKLISKSSNMDENMKYSQLSFEVLSNGDRSGKYASVEPVQRKVVMEDLDFPFDENALRKPAMKTFSLLENENQHLTGDLIEIWTFLHVYHKALLLQPFSFDDFVDTLRYADVDIDCSLLDEIHCAILSVYVNTSSSQLQIQLPEEPPQEDDIDVSKETYEDASMTEANSADEEKDVKEEAEDISVKEETASDEGDNEDDNEEGDEDEDNDGDEKTPSRESTSEPETNKAGQFENFQNQNWTDRLRKRMFKDGGWQQIVIGVLSTVSYVPEWQDIIKDILDEMASLNNSISLVSAYQGYFRLSFPRKINVLRILVSLLESSELVRGYIDKCLEEQTKVRREKTDAQRQIKVHIESLKTIDEEKKPLCAVALSTDLAKRLSLPNEGENAGKIPKNRKDEFEEALAAENEDFAKLMTLQQDGNIKIKELTQTIKEYDENLASLEVQRIRCLGKDRFFNQYWWFEIERPVIVSKHDKKETTGENEENGNVNEGNEKKEDSEKKEAEEEQEEEVLYYSMGRIWIQGPSDEDIRVRLSEEHEVSLTNGNAGKKLYHLERQKLEDGATAPKDSNDWRYFDSFEEIEALVASLNKYGAREVKLLRELENIKPWIQASISARQGIIKADEERILVEAEETVAEEEEDGEFEKEGDDDEVEDDEDGEEDENMKDGEEPDEEKDNSTNEEEEDEEEEDYEEDEDEIITVGKRRKRPVVTRRTRSNAKQRKLNRETTESHKKRVEKRKQDRLEELKKELLEQIPSRILDWTNEEAISELGHSHYESYKKTRGGRRGKR